MVLSHVTSVTDSHAALSPLEAGALEVSLSASAAHADNAIVSPAAVATANHFLLNLFSFVQIMEPVAQLHNVVTIPAREDFSNPD